MVTLLPSTLMPFRSAMPPRSTSRSLDDRRSFIAWIKALAAGQVARIAALGGGRRRSPIAGTLVVEVVHGVLSPQAILLAARQTVSAVAGMAMSFTPSASVSALMKAGGEPIAPASPQPFTPSGLCVQGVTVWSTVKLGRSSARGMV